MAREAQLSKKVRDADKHLKRCGFKTHLCRIENDAGTGNPDVEACIDGVQIWLELKSVSRPTRHTTAVRPKLRPSQDIWLQERVRAGCRTCFVLIQVGDAAASKFYLVPGHLYPRIITPENDLATMSVLPNPNMSLPEILLAATEGFVL